MLHISRIILILIFNINQNNCGFKLFKVLTISSLFKKILVLMNQCSSSSSSSSKGSNSSGSSSSSSSSSSNSNSSSIEDTSLAIQDDVTTTCPHECICEGTSAECSYGSRIYDHLQSWTKYIGTPVI